MPTIASPVFIVCLKYAPGMWQHLSSFGRNLLDRGYPVRFILAPGFRWLNEDFGHLTCYPLPSMGRASFFKNLLSLFWFPGVYLHRLFRHYPPAVILLASWHPWNFLLARLVKKLAPDTPVLAWLHEPYKADKRLYGAKRIAIVLVEWFQGLSLGCLDAAIVHSPRGLRSLELGYPGYRGRKRLIPLQFQDNGFEARAARNYISFLGRAERAKGVDRFFDLVEGLGSEAFNWRFQIVTASNITGYLKKLSPPARARLRVVNSPEISDAVIRQAAARSLAVLALYKETTQSGVIPVALMKGTPIIGTDIEGITDWLRDRETGVIVPPNPSLADIQEAIAYIQSHFAEMSERCRAYYLATFDDRNWEREYGWLLEFLPLSGGRRLNSRGFDNWLR
jgi:glycosyltransferase involved in cell wall biosynthesis